MDAGPTSKREFILEQPDTVAASEVVEAGKKAGLEFPIKYVHSVRYMKRTAKKKAKKAKAAAKAALATPNAKPINVPVKRKLAARVARVPAVTDVLQKQAQEEGVFRAMIVNMGLTRARKVVKEVEEHLANF